MVVLFENLEGVQKAVQDCIDQSLCGRVLNQLNGNSPEAKKMEKWAEKFKEGLKPLLKQSGIDPSCIH